MKHWDPECINKFILHKWAVMGMGLFYILAGILQFVTLGFFDIFELPEDTIFFPDVKKEEM